MARFRGIVQGDDGKQGSRLGHRFIETAANGWNVGVNVDGGIGPDDCNTFDVYATGGSNQRSRSHRIAKVVEVKGGKSQVTVYNSKGRAVARYVV